MCAQHVAGRQLRDGPPGAPRVDKQQYNKKQQQHNSNNDNVSIICNSDSNSPVSSQPSKEDKLEQLEFRNLSSMRVSKRIIPPSGSAARLQIHFVNT